ncbi:MAG: C4-dicarboxylate ABC transporter, partial [Marinobacter sp.]
ATTRGLAEGEYKNGKVLAEFQDKGVQADQIPRDVLLKLRDVTNEVLEEEASKDADFKRVYESQQEFMETYKVWDTRAYVPADL